jgi:hypothetical protein
MLTTLRTCGDFERRFAVAIRSDCGEGIKGLRIERRQRTKSAAWLDES